MFYDQLSQSICSMATGVGYTGTQG